MKVSFITLFLAIVWAIVGVLAFLPFEWCKWVIGGIALFFAFAYYRGYKDEKK